MNFDSNSSRNLQNPALFSNTSENVPSSSRNPTNQVLEGFSQSEKIRLARPSAINIRHFQKSAYTFYKFMKYAARVNGDFLIWRQTQESEVNFARRECLITPPIHLHSSLINLSRAFLGKMGNTPKEYIWFESYRKSHFEKA